MIVVKQRKNYYLLDKEIIPLSREKISLLEKESRITNIKNTPFMILEEEKLLDEINNEIETYVQEIKKISSFKLCDINNYLKKIVKRDVDVYCDLINGERKVVVGEEYFVFYVGFFKVKLEFLNSSQLKYNVLRITIFLKKIYDEISKMLKGLKKNLYKNIDFLFEVEKIGKKLDNLNMCFEKINTSLISLEVNNDCFFVNKNTERSSKEVKIDEFKIKIFSKFIDEKIMANFLKNDISFKRILKILRNNFLFLKNKLEQDIYYILVSEEFQESIFNLVGKKIDVYFNSEYYSFPYFEEYFKTADFKNFWETKILKKIFSFPIIDELNMGIFFLDNEFFIITYKCFQCEFCERELRGENFFNLLWVPDRRKLKNYLKKCDFSKPLYIHFVADSKLVLIKLKVKKIPFKKKNYYFFIIQNLSSEERQFRFQLYREKMALISTFMSNVIHEFSNILAIQKGFVESLESKINKNGLIELKNISSSIKRAEELLRKLSLFLPEGAVTDRKDHQYFNLNEFIDEYTHFFPTLADKVKYDLDNTISKVYGRYLSLKTFFVGFLDMFSSSRELDLEIKTSKKKDKVFFELLLKNVRHERKKIFSAIQDKLKELNLIPSLFKGKDFLKIKFSFDVHGLEDMDSISDISRSLHSLRKENKSILVVDDENLIRDMLKDFLGKFYDVDTAVNGLDALQKVKRKKYDLIILDVIMPKMNGEEFLERFSKFRKDEKIIIISGYTDKFDVKSKAKKYNIYEIVRKPFNLVNLLKIVNGLLHTKK